MSSPNTSLLNNYSTPNSSPSAANAAAISRDGRKRLSGGAPVYSTNETLNQMTQEAERKQQEKTNVQKEIRAIRAQEMEKQRKEDEERERNENSRFNRSSNTASTNGSTATASSLAGTTLANKTRTYSTTSRADSESYADTDNPKELKKKLAEMEEKYRKHAIYQTQFENDQQKLIYEVELLKDLIEEHEELIIELRRQFKDKSKELDFQKRSYKDLQTDFFRLKEILKQRDALIEDSGLILYTDNETKKKAAMFNNISNSSSSSPALASNKQPASTTASVSATSDSSTTTKDQEASQIKEESNEIKSVLPAALVAPETAKLLDMLGEGTIDDKLRKILNERQELKEHNTKLLIEIEEERTRCENLEKKLVENANKIQTNQEASQDLHDIQRQFTKEINELKMKIQKLEHENIIIKQDKQRLDTQLKYLQTNFDELEQTERRLIKEKREQQREYRELKTKYQDSLLDAKRLQDRIDSLEFYAKTNTNSSVFHNLIPSTYLSNSSTSSGGGAGSSARSRTPAPIPPRSTRTSNGTSSGINYGGSSSSTTTPSSYYTSNPLSSFYDTLTATRTSSSRPSSRQSSVERFADTSIRSRNSSPSRSIYDTPSISSYDKWSSRLSGLPPHPTSSYESYATLRSKREPSSDRLMLRKRESSQDRSGYGSALSSRPPTASSSLLKFRRASFVENHPVPKYY